MIRIMEFKYSIDDCNSLAEARFDLAALETGLYELKFDLEVYISYSQWEAVEIVANVIAKQQKIKYGRCR